MICPICQKEFEPIKRLGGQNRLICYDCLPDGLSKNERTVLKRKLFDEVVNREKIARGCDVCGYNICPAALEWHHDGDDKSFNPSDKIRLGSTQGLLDYRKEIEKCTLLCANCHREIHYFETFG